MKLNSILYVAILALGVNASAGANPEPAAEAHGGRGDRHNAPAKTTSIKTTSLTPTTLVKSTTSSVKSTTTSVKSTTTSVKSTTTSVKLTTTSVPTTATSGTPVSTVSAAEPSIVDFCCLYSSKVDIYSDGSKRYNKQNNMVCIDIQRVCP